MNGKPYNPCSVPAQPARRTTLHRLSAAAVQGVGGRITLAARGAFAFGLSTSAKGQTSPQTARWPVRTIKIIAPVNPGGGVDLVARLMAEQLTQTFGQPVVVENIGGGGGAIGSQATARAQPDGYTLMVGYVGTHGTNPALRKLPYDALTDFTPIGMVGGTPNVLVVNPGFGATHFAGLRAALKAEGDKLSYASSGPGTLTHLVMEQLKGAVGSNIVHVPYKGIGPALVDVMGGQVQMACPGLAAALPHILSGKLRAIAMTGTKRHRLLPHIPTFEELGLKGFDGVQWYGIVGPARLPAPIVERLNGEINRIIALPTIRNRLSAEALEPMPMAPSQFGHFMAQDIARWAKVAVARNIQMEQ